MLHDPGGHAEYWMREYCFESITAAGNLRVILLYYFMDKTSVNTFSLRGKKIKTRVTALKECRTTNHIQTAITGKLK